MQRPSIFSTESRALTDLLGSQVNRSGGLTLQCVRDLGCKSNVLERPEPSSDGLAHSIPHCEPKPTHRVT